MACGLPIAKLGDRGWVAAPWLPPTLVVALAPPNRNATARRSGRSRRGVEPAWRRVDQCRARAEQRRRGSRLRDTGAVGARRPGMPAERGSRPQRCRGETRRILGRPSVGDLRLRPPIDRQTSSSVRTRYATHLGILALGGMRSTDHAEPPRRRFLRQNLPPRCRRRRTTLCLAARYAPTAPGTARSRSTPKPHAPSPTSICGTRARTIALRQVAYQTAERWQPLEFLAAFSRARTSLRGSTRRQHSARIATSTCSCRGMPMTAPIGSSIPLDLFQACPGANTRRKTTGKSPIVRIRPSDGRSNCTGT